MTRREVANEMAQNKHACRTCCGGLKNTPPGSGKPRWCKCVRRRTRAVNRHL